MKKTPCIIPFFLALFFALFGTAFFPSFRLFAFSPFLAILYHRVALLPALWVSLFCGCILDLFSSQFRFGIFGLDFAVTTLFLYTQKRHFFEDKPFAFSFFSALISSFQSLILVLLCYLIDRPLHLHLSWLVSDLIVMPFLDAIYAFIWFTCPIWAYQTLRRRGWSLFSFKREENE